MPPGRRPSGPSVEQRIAFDQAVTHPWRRVILLASDNSRAGHKRWSPQEAVESNVAYFLWPHPKFTPVDFDTDEAMYAQDGITRAMAFTEQLWKDGIPFVSLTSGGNNSAHVWCVVHPAKGKAFAETIRDFDGDDRTRKGIRPPFAPHRSGGEMALIYPGTFEEALLILKAPHADDIRHEDRQAHDLLVQAGEPNRSRHIFRTAGHYKRKGYSECAFVYDVLRHPDGAGHKLYYPNKKERRPNPKRWQYLEKAYRKADPPAMPEAERRRFTETIATLRAMGYAAAYRHKRTNLLPTYLMILDVAEYKAFGLTFHLSQAAYELTVATGEPRCDTSKH